MATTTTTNFALPIPPLGATGTSDGYDTLQQTADTNLKNAIAPPNAVGTIADHAAIGQTFTGTAGENVAIGDVCYLKTDGKYWKARGNAAATMPAMAMATATINADATGVFLLRGIIRDDNGWGGALTIGTPTGRLWVSAATAGLATQTQPSTATNLVQDIGYAVAARIIFFDPNRTLVEVA